MYNVVNNISDMLECVSVMCHLLAAYVTMRQ